MYQKRKIRAEKKKDDSKKSLPSECRNYEKLKERRIINGQ